MNLCKYCFALVLLLCPLLTFSSDLPSELLLEVTKELEDQLRFDPEFSSMIEAEFDSNTSIRPLFYEPEDNKRASWNRLEMGRWFRVNAPQKSLYDIQKHLYEIEGVLSVEAVFPHYSNLVPDDMNNYDMWGLVNMNLPEAWDSHQTDSEILIAVLDSGCRIDHPDLEANIYINPGEDLNQNGVWDESDNDGIDNDENGFIDDICGWDFMSYVPEEWEIPAEGEDYGPPDNLVYPDISSHGTHVAGSAAAVTNNGTGVASASWNSKLLPIRCAYTIEEQDGSIMTFGPPLDFISGMQYAVDMGANIINISYGGGFYQPYQDAVTYARENNCLVFTSGGNGNTNEIQYPAGFIGATAVAAIDVNYQKASFSNYGDYISLAAPGVNIWSTMPHSPYDPVDYDSKNGTSMASPNAASVAAYVWSLNPSFTDDQVLEIITLTCRNIDEENPGYIGQLGAGFIDAEAAIQLALEMSIPYPQFIGYELDDETGQVNLEWTLDDQGRDDFLGFNLYLNDEYLTSPEDTSYTYQFPEFGTYTFAITAMFGEEESAPDELEIFWNPYYGFPFFAGFEEGLTGWYRASEGINIVQEPVLEGINSLSMVNSEATSTVLHYFESREDMIVEVYSRSTSPPDLSEGFTQGIVLNEGLEENRLAFSIGALSQVILFYDNSPHSFALFEYPIFGTTWLKTRLYYSGGNLFVTIADSDFNIMATLGQQVSDIALSNVGLIVNQTNSPAYYDNFQIYHNEVDYFDPVAPTENAYPIVFSINPEILEAFDLVEVAMFDDELCVGAVAVTDNPYTELLTWGATQEQPGFTEGNPIFIKGYIGDEDREVFLPLEEMSVGDGTFGYETYTKLLIGQGSSSTPEDGQFIPESFNVGKAYPNPFNPSITIPVVLPESGNTEMRVFNILGQAIYQNMSYRTAGSHQLIFNSNLTGHNLPNGLYFLSISDGKHTITQKIVLMK